MQKQHRDTRVCVCESVAQDGLKQFDNGEKSLNGMKPHENPIKIEKFEDKKYFFDKDQL